MKQGTRQFWKDFFALLMPFWRSKEKWPAIGLLVVIIACTLGAVFLSVQFSFWYNRFYQALQDYNQPAFWREIAIFSGLATVSVLRGVYAVYLGQWLRIRWRRWMTDHLLGEWLADRAYYRQQLTTGATDNPDQRISDDIQQFVDGTLTLSLSFLGNVVNLFSFAVILWGLAAPLTIPLFGGGGITIPHFMLWAAIVYAIVGTILTHLLGRPLIRLNFMQQKREADFRFGLVRFRENTEAIALYGGEASERQGLLRLFGGVMENFYQLMSRTKKLGFFTSAYGQASAVFPGILVAPQYFAKTIELGGVVQVIQAFGNVQDSLSWFVSAYSTLADYKATVDRLTGFRRSLEDAKAAARSGGIDMASDTRTNLAVETVQLALPDGQPLLEGHGLSVQPGDRLLLTGPSGAGKSTLFRALAGIWPFGKAKIRLPGNARVLFLPQRPYLPLGSLHTAVAYPAKPEEVPAETAAEALRAVDLSHLVPALEQEEYWARRLSPGEQQRLAIARAILTKPDWLFLDEATSALDEATEERMFALLRDRLPGTTWLTISHDPKVAAFHDRHWRIEKDGVAPARLVEAPEAAAA
ncbi:putative ATP-binding cassette transporter [Inquilinus ginsengisoli]|uniref:ATP-binding cassette transporter n=1 Tax=Inquilinus ginsengisoli TaxID=363840 RepID=A0ABU1K099_9PROT|nr:ABC transporter ATP-binding protein/permease [Inquilinus ginsengisoli]MDR6294292.1 putative ATP-binding cassette transporter [Inquilinus ginsengisoli]